MIDHGLLHPNELLHQDCVTNADLMIFVLQLLELLLGRHELGVHQIHLLRRHRIIHHLRGFPGRGGFPTNIIQRVFVVRLELWMFEFPCLDRLAA